MKKIFVSLVSFLFFLFLLFSSPCQASNSLDIVINEIAWMGSESLEVRVLPPEQVSARFERPSRPKIANPPFGGGGFLVE
ncbi:hypothetical protein KJA14_02340 [Patescibacteria group bacterium]|nr:hypothetical protein [Patescibacteria group bacterium]